MLPLRCKDGGGGSEPRFYAIFKDKKVRSLSPIPPTPVGAVGATECAMLILCRLRMLAQLAQTTPQTSDRNQSPTIVGGVFF